MAALAALAAPVIAATTLFTASRAAWAGAALGSLGMVFGAVRWRLAPWTAGTYKWAARAVTTVLLTGALLLIAATTWATLRDIRLDQQRNYFDVVLYTVNLRAPSRGAPEGARAVLGRRRADGAGAPLGGHRRGTLLQGVVPLGPEPGRARQTAGERAQLPAATRGGSGAADPRGLPRPAVRGGPGGAPRLPSGAAVHARFVALASAAGIAAFLVTLFTGHSLLLHEGQVTFWPLVALAFLCGREWANAEPRSTSNAGALALAALSLVLLVTLPARLDSAVTLEDVRVSGLVADAPPRSRWRRLDGRTRERRRSAAARAASSCISASMRLPRRPSRCRWTAGRSRTSRDSRPGPRTALHAAESRSQGEVQTSRADRVPNWTPPGTGTELGVVIESVEWVP